ncbi:(d)CMP kinase [Craterilacuibacter sp.]|uniref:(d)CMP kinase n=1 Tax=Craterilacuibacter sp. TaxID=2870909 RepID=UPI003F30B247
MTIAVITIDGPSASGKGTVAALVAEKLGFAYLDSGALYRLTALHARRHGVSWADEAAVATLARTLPAVFCDGEILLDGENVADAIRSEEVGMGASVIAALPQVRAALLERQRAYRVAPGLVTDGRDMGSVVFPDATLKIFLTASADVRAGRRYKQLISKEDSANLPRILQDITERDARDAARSVAPLRQEPDARLLDTSEMSVDLAVAAVLGWYGQSV